MGLIASISWRSYGRTSRLFCSKSSLYSESYILGQILLILSDRTLNFNWWALLGNSSGFNGVNLVPQHVLILHLMTTPESCPVNSTLKVFCSAEMLYSDGKKHSSAKWSRRSLLAHWVVILYGHKRYELDSPRCTCLFQSLTVTIPSFFGI